MPPPAVSGGLLRMYASTPGLMIDSGLYSFGRRVSREIRIVYTMRMAGVFMVSTCALSLRTGIIPRAGWRTLAFVLAVFLLLTLGEFYWAPLAFPLWVLLMSVHILPAILR